ncbi:MAG: GntR family transcriptional regulator [bacterium]|nr:GntR family transcriptional regulator [bacterium]
MQRAVRQVASGAILDGELQQRTLVDGVVLRIREAILEGELLPGEPVPLRDLAARLSVSVMPVRDALRRLAAEGLIEYSPHRGARVAPVSSGDLEQLYELRIAIETAAVRAAVPKLTVEEYAHLRRIVDSNEDPRDPEADLKSRQAHQDFHFGIYDVERSRWLKRTLPPLWEASERYRRLGVRRRGSPAYRWSEHGVILDRMVSGDVDGAAEALEQHLRTTLQMLKRYLSELTEAHPVGASRR